MVAATILLREAIRLDPELFEARRTLGVALQSMGDLDGAVEELRALVTLQPNLVSARYSLATALMAKQDWSSARRELEEALRQRPELEQAHYSLGFVRYSLGDLKGAIEAYQQVLARSPDHVDARYSLAVVMKLAQGDAGATKEFLAAAQAGHPRAQYFAGTAYARGFGVEPDLGRAIMWWSRSAEQGVSEARASVGELRQIMLGRGRRALAERQATERAFQSYRAMLWDQFPGLARNGPDDTVGAALLRQGRAREAVAMLIREASSFSEPAQALLVSLYSHGLRGQQPAHDEKILEYLTIAADEGQVGPRIALARFYAAGLGVPKDLARAIALLKATPHEDAQRLLQELSATGEAVPVPTRP